MKSSGMTQPDLERVGPPTDAGILRWLASQASFPPFTAEVRDVTGPRESGVDATITMTFGGVQREFAVEARARASARALRDAVTQIQAKVPSGMLPLIVCPFLSTELARQLLAEGVSGIDMCGNVAVVVPGTWYVERLGAPNRFPDTRLVKNVFRGASSMVPRVLLSGESFRSATDLLAAIAARGGSTSLPTVSRVLRQLEDDALVTRAPEIRTTDRERLLRRFVAEYQPANARRRVAGRVADLDEARVTIANAALTEGFRVVGVAPERYVSFPSSYPELVVYSTAADAALRDIQIRTDGPFQNLIVYETEDPTVFFDTRAEEGFVWASPLEVYLRLATGDERMREMAKSLKPRLIGSEIDGDR